MSGFQMPHRWSGRTPSDETICVVAYCPLCNGLKCACPEPGPEDTAMFSALEEEGGFRVTRERWDCLTGPYCECGDYAPPWNNLYRFALLTMAGVVLGVLLFPMLREQYGPAIAWLGVVACSVCGGYWGSRWGGVGIKVGIQKQ